MPQSLARMLANPLRNRLLFEFQGAATCPSEVARRMGQPLNLVSYHTAVLVRHGLLEPVGTVQRRGGTTHFYRATTVQSIDGDEWSNTPLPLRRALMRGVLTATADRARAALLEGGFDESQAHLSRLPLVLDDVGVQRVAGILRDAVDDIISAHEASDRREPTTRRSYEVVLMGFGGAHELTR